MRRALFVLISALALSGGHAMAGVVLTVTETNLGDNKTRPMTVYLDTDRMKVVNDKDIMIFRGDLKRMWAIEGDERKYTEMSPETVQQMSAQVSGAMAQMQAQLAQLPPEQRAQIEAMMAQRGGALAAPAQRQVTYTRAGGGKTVGAWRCEQYAKMVNGQKEEELCMAPIGSVGINADDLKVLESISTMMGPITQQAPNRGDYLSLDAVNKAIGFQGIPLETVYYSDGKPERRNTVSKIDRTSIPASTFEIPPGFTKKEMNFGQPPHR